MIARIGILIAGLLLGVAAVLLGKKLSTPWRAALLAAALLVTGIGGGFTYAFWHQQQTDQSYVYLSLRYLEHSDTDAAAYYLKKVSADSFDSLCAQGLLETMRDNAVLARMKLDGAEARAKTGEQKNILQKVSAVGQDEQSRQAAVQVLLAAAAPSARTTARLDARFSAESGYYLPDVDLTEQTQNEEDSLRQQVSYALSNGSYSSAVYSAAALVGQRASAQNRLLLAETIAEAAYSGYGVTGDEFMLDQAEADQTADKERDELQQQLLQVQQQASEVEALLWSATDEDTVQSLSQESAQLNSQAQALQQQYDNIFIRRAFSSIADLHSLDAEIVRARLYFAMNDYAAAVECLQQASTSLEARLTTDTALRNALNILNESYAGEQSLGAASAEFRSAMDTVLTAGALDHVGVSASPLTQDLITYIISEQKSYGKDLYVSHIDLSAYPQVTVSLAGRDTVVQSLLDGATATVRDTQQAVDYTISASAAEDRQRNVVCVVDESGSMLGDPLMDAQAALTGFISSLDNELNLALVSFDDTARLRTEMGADRNSQLAAVEQIGNGGGTDITAGLAMAIQAAQGSESATTVLLMTDGQSSLDMDVVQQAASLGMVIHTIGFGSVDDDVLQSIADATGGQYIRADSSSELISVYFSLVGMIGNEVQVSYTAPEAPAEAQRYFFLRAEDAGVSVRVDYALASQPQPRLTGLSQSLFTPDELAYAQERGSTLTLQLYGENLLDVTAVTIGGQPAQVDEDARYDGSSLTVSLSPQLSPGWQTIELTTADGQVYSVEHMLAVGEWLNCSTYFYGPIRIETYNAALLPDGTLILSDGYFTDETTTEDGQTQSTLSMRFSGLLSATVDGQGLLADVAYHESQGLPMRALLDGGAPLTGGGTVTLQSTDSGYDSRVSDPVVSGNYLLQCDGDQVKLIQQ